MIKVILFSLIVACAQSGKIIFQEKSSDEIKQPDPPVLPFEFNSSLYKLDDQDIPSARWAKLYYNYVPIGQNETIIGGGYSRFDFYDRYYNLKNDWQISCSIYFGNNSFWFVFPNEQKCKLASNNLGNIDAYWLKDADFGGYELFRGMYAEKWVLDLGPGEAPIIYYNKPGDKIKIPLRSTNQDEDPGATDYFDVEIGPQDQSLFTLPAYCLEPENTTDEGCPLDDIIKLFGGKHVH